MQQVLGGQTSSVDDNETMAQGQSLMETTFNNARSTKDQRTFQDMRNDQMLLVANQSFNNGSVHGFAPEVYESQKQIVSAFNNAAGGLNGEEIVSGTFIATKSNDKIKVYPEEVKERLMSHMPQRTRVNRVPTSKQL